MEISEGLARASVVARVNGELRDLNKPLKNDCKLELIKFDSKEGKDIFWHSSTHLMAQAVLELFPEAKLTIGPVVENGFYYDFGHPLFEVSDLEKIEAKMKEIAERKLPISRLEMTKTEALKLFKDNYYKTEIIKEVEDNEKITAYKQGDFIDLCRGPHLPSTSRIKAFKLTKISGAYWRGDSNNAQLQRIYGISFPSKDELKEFLKRIEEAEKRDHRKIGKDLDLYSFHQESPGAPFFHPKGTIIYNELLKFVREEYIKRGYNEVITPLLYDKSLWETSGHWEHYQKDMFFLDIEGKTFNMKPMNCPLQLPNGGYQCKPLEIPIPTRDYCLNPIF